MGLSTVPRYRPESVCETSDDAIVVGASMAGMLAARVLADRYAAVTVIDRDPLVDEPTPRPGVTQATQLHALLEGGRATIEDLFPGYCDALVDAGGVPVDTGSDVEFYDDGVELARSGNERTMYCASRPLVELVDREPSIDEFLIPDVAGTSHHLIELACEMESIYSARHLPFIHQLTTVFERASDSEISRPDCLVVVFAVILGVEAIMGRSARITRMDRRPASRGHPLPARTTGDSRSAA